MTSTSRASSPPDSGSGEGKRNGKAKAQGKGKVKAKRGNGTKGKGSKDVGAGELDDMLKLVRGDEEEQESDVVTKVSGKGCANAKPKAKKKGKSR